MPADGICEFHPESLHGSTRRRILLANAPPISAILRAEVEHDDGFGFKRGGAGVSVELAASGCGNSITLIKVQGCGLKSEEKEARKR